MKKILLAGGSGFLGQRLATHFSHTGKEVVVLTRSQARGGAIGRKVYWDGCTPGDWTQELEGVDAAINLAGRSVNCRYHARNRRSILDSRVNSTRALGDAIARCSQPPRVWLNASTATVYRHTLGPAWDETGEIAATAEAKDLFSVEVAEAWEHALFEAQTPATRKVCLRTAMVLGRGKNSVLPVLLRLVRSGLGGALAGGSQFVSWIHESDFCRAVEWLIERDDFTGPVNVVAPEPVTNRELMRTLRCTCEIPFGLPVSRWMLEFGAFFLRTETELVIKSRRVVPGRLTASGFEFCYPTVVSALRDLASAWTAAP